MKMGAFGGSYSRLILIPNNELIIVINSSTFDPLKKGKEFNELIRYLKTVN